MEGHTTAGADHAEEVFSVGQRRWVKRPIAIMGMGFTESVKGLEVWANQVVADITYTDRGGFCIGGGCWIVFAQVMVGVIGQDDAGSALGSSDGLSKRDGEGYPSSDRGVHTRVRILEELQAAGLEIDVTQGNLYDNAAAESS